jgi:hypothetical protein
MKRARVIASLWMIATVLAAQNPPSPPSLTYGSVRTPEIQLGSGSSPTIITVPPVVEVSSAPAEPQVSNAPPANTALLALRHFDYIVSPIAQDLSTRGSMADTSISLGEYARQLRAKKQAEVPKSTPDAMSQPSAPR